MAKKTLFISHISDEKALAHPLKQRIHKDFLGMIDIFVSSDRQSIGAGSKWLDEVEKALKGADLQLVLCSNESVGRPWVNFEAGAVWLRGIPVIPVCHSGMRPNDLPVPLSMLQGIECSQPEGLQQVYEAIAQVLNTHVPATDFAKVCGELQALEKAYMQARTGVAVIEHPRILCAASEQYAEPSLGFHLDVAVLEQKFPGRVTVESKLTSKRLLDLLTSERFDIVHLVLAVEPDSGDLVFSPINFGNYKPATGRPDTMAPTSFARLLRESQTRLVVLATCKALLLSVEVAHVANMATSHALLKSQDAADWAYCFYGQLAQGKTVHKAFDITKSFINVPVRAIRHIDVAFARGAS